MEADLIPYMWGAFESHLQYIVKCELPALEPRRNIRIRDLALAGECQPPSTHTCLRFHSNTCLL